MTVRIESDGAEPPSGVVIGRDGVLVPFAGWLDLMQAIERSVSCATPEPGGEVADGLQLSEAEAV